MKKLTDSAQNRLDNYLNQVRTSLHRCKSVDANEVERDIKEHIETELSDMSEPVSLEDLEAVLDRLGSPSQWVPEEEISWWRKIILRLRKGHEDWRLAYLSFGLFVLGFLFPPLFIAGFIISRAALSFVGDRKELGVQKWLIYPSLIVFYLFLLFVGFWLLVWPIAALGELAQEFDHVEKDVFPWSTGDETAYWLIAFVFIAGATFLWWLILGLVHKRKPVILQTIFRPFADWIKPKWTNWFITMTLVLTLLLSVIGVIMIKYQAWYTCFKEIST